MNRRTSLAAVLSMMTMALAASAPASSAPAPAAAAGGSAEPNYDAWTALLKRYYDPARGMNYAALKGHDLQALETLRVTLGSTDVRSLSHDEQLAFWINLYNINATAIVAEKYPIKSIRDLSTDILIRLNVFDKPWVPFGKEKISLNKIENDNLRAGFHDPRIHFAINCAARSCPTIRTEAYAGARVNAQLDDQVRTFLNGSKGMRIEGKTVHVTKVMSFFKDDFAKWGGGAATFLRRFANAENRGKLDAAGNNLRIDYDSYDWSLNDRS